ncbi:hypothetical protein MIV032R [Invertebrate iridescent virus 3]|uniref:Uncharacterized protein 032R n=1 Tax=Invertebrate iridescent virus 3 TaxID=345201 RepID=032R_IIV3|nr:hypothetical protein MIV032R [Invertebrate iridescent virus 3]Q197C8.1 RecName: Full=Uncharacterized protein 032R [Invertebrate iridescent virus 3]ABF82062.1 hypothetical protein MIV032R [Invertebrate iridescent virus 3]
MKLMLEIVKNISEPVGKLAIWFNETYQVDVSETINKWNELTGMNITVQENAVSADDTTAEETEYSVVVNENPTRTAARTRKESKTAAKPRKMQIPKTKDVCQHIFKSGSRAGEQCTTKPKNNALFCSAHRVRNSVTSNATEASEKTVAKTNGTAAPQKRGVKSKSPTVIPSDFDDSDSSSSATRGLRKAPTLSPRKPPPTTTTASSAQEEEDEQQAHFSGSSSPPPKNNGNGAVYSDSSSDEDDDDAHHTTVIPLLKKGARKPLDENVQFTSDSSDEED